MLKYLLTVTVQYSSTVVVTVQEPTQATSCCNLLASAPHLSSLFIDKYNMCNEWIALLLRSFCIKYVFLRHFNTDPTMRFTCVVGTASLSNIINSPSPSRFESRLRYQLLRQALCVIACSWKTVVKYSKSRIVWSLKSSLWLNIMKPFQMTCCIDTK
jgi:hypothetical protein